MPLLPTPDITAPCPHATICGGCDFQDVLYSRQTAYKEAVLRELFTGLVPENAWRPFLATTDPQPFYYRNKIRYGFVEVGEKILPSRHAKGETDADIPMRVCLLQSDLSVEIAHATAEFATKAGWKVFSTTEPTGFLKHILIREGKRTGEFMVSLVTTEKAPDLSEWARSVQSLSPQIKSIYQTKTWGRNNEHQEDHLLAGESKIREKIGEYEFVISPHAFFQTNSLMVEKLYNLVRDSARLQPTDCLWDLYAGSATIGMYLSKDCKRVISIENNLQNIADAEENIALNDVKNLEVFSGSVDQIVNSQFINAHTADGIVVDPPRAGLSPYLRRLLPHIPHRRLVYVSCNPQTLKRDLEDLTRSGYKVGEIRGVDMFPHTLHCEMVVVFEK